MDTNIKTYKLSNRNKLYDRLDEQESRKVSNKKIEEEIEANKKDQN